MAMFLNLLLPCMKNKGVELNYQKTLRTLIFCGFIIKATNLGRHGSQRWIRESYTNLEEKQWHSLSYKVLRIQMVTK